MSDLQDQAECSHAWPNMVRYLDQKCMSCGVSRFEVDTKEGMNAFFERMKAEKKDMTTNLAKMFQAYRQKYDRSQSQLAELIGISHSTMCRIEQGADFDLDALTKIFIWMRETK